MHPAAKPAARRGAGLESMHSTAEMSAREGAGPEGVRLVQEMYEESARAVQQALGKPPRLRLFLTPAMEEDMTPEQYQDGNDFFSHAQHQDQFWCAGCSSALSLRCHHVQWGVCSTETWI